MKFGKTLAELAVEVDRQSKERKDYLISTDTIEAIPADTGITLRLPMSQTEYPVSALVDQQIGTYLSIPAKYYEKMSNEYPYLLAANVNGWFGKNTDDRMIRTLDGRIRAFLSDRYRRIDNEEILKTVLPILESLHTQEDARVESCEVTDSRLYIKIVNPSLQAEIVPGDTVQAGILISNSEVGLGSVSVQPLIYRVNDKSGLIKNNAGMRKYHIGRTNTADEDYNLFSDETMEAEDLAFMLKIRDTVMAVTDQARFEQIVEELRQAKDAKITSTNIPKLIELTNKAFCLSKDEGAGMLNDLIRSGDMSRYGMANAVTAQASVASSYDRSTELEAIGYDVAAMPDKAWEDLNKESQKVGTATVSAA